jgi:hypothetical protein
MVVLVLVASKGAGDATADRLREGVFAGDGGAGLVEILFIYFNIIGALAQLAHGEQPGVAGELTRRRLHDERVTEEFRDF